MPAQRAPARLSPAIDNARHRHPPSLGSTHTLTDTHTHTQTQAASQPLFNWS